MPSKLVSAAAASTAIAIVLNAIVYFYPVVFNAPGKCTWHNFDAESEDTLRFRALDSLLPQSLIKYFGLLDPFFGELQQDQGASAHLSDRLPQDIRMLTFGDPQINGNWKLTSYIKRLDNFGNDYYLGHIYSVMKARTRPSHVAVMGDMFLLQWILDSEFYNRTRRFALRLFDRPLEYKQNVMETHQKHEDYDWLGYMEREHEMDPADRYQSRVYHDMYDWVHPNRTSPNFENPLFINLTGNHDIGYSGDATWQHMARFHHLFGQNNYVIDYNRGQADAWRLVVLDSLTLEGPALQPEFLDYSWSFLHHLRDDHNPGFKGPTVLLTHVPFYKRAGLCTDGPEHRYYADHTREPYKNGMLRSHNHLSYNTSQQVLSIVFPNPSQNGIILTGHDHVGCDSWYNYVDGNWLASKQVDATSNRLPIREIVVRSMMGDFGGYTGIFTGHFDKSVGKWMFHFDYCKFTVQHLWWASKVALFVAIFLQTLSWTL